MDILNARYVPPEPKPERLFVAVMPGGLSYCDRTREEHGDYLKLAFLSYLTLRLTFTPAGSAAPKPLYDEIKAHALTMQRRRGEQFQISATGQTVLLGSAA